MKIDNFAFTPGALTVKAGSEVTWTNHDDIPHTVDSTQGKFKSAALDSDQKFQFRFTEPGEFPYYCRMHPKMTGSVIVLSWRLGFRQKWQSSPACNGRVRVYNRRVGLTAIRLAVSPNLPAQMRPRSSTG